MLFEQYVVDAFTQKPFGGNPAAIVVLDAFLDTEVMQQWAAQNNLSETAFLVPQGQGYHIRWFSPLSEIDFCGHASLASAYVLQRFYQAGERITLSCAAIGDYHIDIADDGLISMQFPNFKPGAVAQIPEALLLGLSLPPVRVLKNQQAYFAVYETKADVLALTIDAAQLKQLAPYDVVATALDVAEADFVSRYFWPANGGDEDPVTGSIHAGLFPYWAMHLGKSDLLAHQVSKRGGVLYGHVTEEFVTVSGYARLFAQGQVHLALSVPV